jgi:ABC-type transporter Mla subunit MlaD
MAFENFEEVWAALGRLYSNITRLEEAQQRAVAQHAEQLAQTTERLDRLASIVATLAGTAAQHEERLDQVTERIDRLTSTVATLVGTVAQLATVAESHTNSGWGDWKDSKQIQ